MRAGETIRPLSPLDSASYLAFRREMWPLHSAAGDWETVGLKYFDHPHAAQCPGTALYGYFQGDALLGIMGAFPLPVTLDGSLHPGHMLVDWAVLPRVQGGPVAGRLWAALLELPGRKYASNGSPGSQGPLSRRGREIPSRLRAVAVRPFAALAVKLLRLASYAQPWPVRAEDLPLPPGVTQVPPSSLRAEEPSDPGTAYVRKEGPYWTAFCGTRVLNGAVPIRMTHADGEADLVLTLLRAGRYGIAALPTAALFPPTAACRRRTGVLLGTLLRRWGVCVLLAEENGDRIDPLLRAAAPFVRQQPTRWWAIPKPTDRFAVDDVKWWLTLAERDSHWGHVPPSLGGIAPESPT